MALLGGPLENRDSSDVLGACWTSLSHVEWELELVYSGHQGKSDTTEGR